MKHFGAWAWLLAALLSVTAALAPASAMEIAPILKTVASTASETGVWPMMLGGFILVCSALRRRRDRSLYRQAA